MNLFTQWKVKTRTNRQRERIVEYSLIGFFVSLISIFLLWGLCLLIVTSGWLGIGLVSFIGIASILSWLIDSWVNRGE